MHVHLPKPIHGWRQFFGEVGIIVVGVLIALAAEQVVESVHWHHVVGETEESLNATLKDAYASMLSRQDMQSCVDRRLVELGTVLDRHDKGQPLGLTGPIGAPTASFTQTYAFDMAIASQAFSHMAIADQAKFFEPLGTYRTFDDVVKEERSVWQTFRALDRAGSLTPADWSDVRKAYDRASSLSMTFAGNLRGGQPGQWLYPFRAFATPTDYSLRDIPRVQQLCRSVIDTPRGAAARGG